MILHTFQILPKIKQGKERQIHSQKIFSWDHFLQADSIKFISHSNKLIYDQILKIAKKELYKENSNYFTSILPQTETWRLFEFFQQDAVYLDIETTGLERDSLVYMIGLFDGIETKLMFHNINLDYDYLQKYLNSKKIIITYNGSSFDLPFLKKQGLKFNMPHIDLKPLLAKLGFKGGLKEIEKQFKIKRNPIITNLYGGDVYRLWRMYKATGDYYYLKLLIEYNEDDVYNLKKLMLFCYKKLKSTLLANNFKY